MKKLFNSSVAGVAFAMSLAMMQISCSSDNKTSPNQAANNSTVRSTASESEAAYSDFKNYVSTLDSNATASAEQRSEYDKKVARLDKYTNDYNESRRQEIDQLKARYGNYWNIIGTTRSGGITPKAVPTWPMPNTGITNLSDFNPAAISASSPSAIRQAYERFLAKVQVQKDHFTKEDWEKVEAYYEALDDRKDQMQSQLSDKDKYEIAKAKAKYVAMKTGEKMDSAMNQVAQDVKQTGKKAEEKVENTAEKVGDATKETGKDVKTGAKKTTKKVKEAAKETGKDVKEATTKGSKAVGNTAKKAGEKVDDALDGKKETE